MQVHNAKDVDTVTPVHNSIEYSNQHSDVYVNTIEMNQVWTIKTILMIFPLKIIMIIVFPLNLKKNKQETMAQKIFI